MKMRPIHNEYLRQKEHQDRIAPIQWIVIHNSNLSLKYFRILPEKGIGSFCNCLYKSEISDLLIFLFVKFKIIPDRIETLIIDEPP